MRKLWLAGFLLFTAHIARAGEPLVIDVRHSTLAFEIGIAGGLSSVEGSFGRWEGRIDYDPENMEQSSVSITIDVASINTGVAGRDAHLREPDFFDAAKYPEITFRSTSTRRSGGGFVLSGPLAMHGVTNPVRIDFRRVHAEPFIRLFDRDTVIFEGSTTVSRRAFGIQATSRWNGIVEATGEAAMSDEVTIRLRIIAQRETK